MDGTLLRKARKAREEKTYSVHSGFRVGACIETGDGSHYTGANIENINYTNTAHAEQVAFYRAWMNDHREFVKMGLSLSGEPAPPCGLCRQTLIEFCDDDFEIHVDDLGIFTLGQLLPSEMKNIE